MKAQELRLGNWVSMSKDGVTINVKVEPSILMILTGEVDKKGIEINPITLTEEILLKCGFEWFKPFKCYSHKQLNIYIGLNTKKSECYALHCLNIDDYNGVKKTKYDGKLYLTSEAEYLVSETPIEYLHQLQNLFHSLTGTELEIKHTPY